jgi:hypothetical protein
MVAARRNKKLQQYRMSEMQLYQFFETRVGKNASHGGLGSGPETKTG